MFLGDDFEDIGNANKMIVSEGLKILVFTFVANKLTQ